MAVTEAVVARCVEVLRAHGARRIVLFGSALDSPETAADLDLAVEGLEGRAFFRAGAEAERIAGVPLDLIPLDPPTPFSSYIERKGRILLG